MWLASADVVGARLVLRGAGTATGGTATDNFVTRSAPSRHTQGSRLMSATLGRILPGTFNANDIDLTGTFVSP